MMSNRFLTRYRSIPPAAKASIWFMVCSVLQKGLAFIAIPIYTRLLTTTEYGTYSVYNAWLSLFMVFATLSMSSDYYVIAVLKNEMDAKKILSILQGCSSATCIIFFIVIFVIYKPISEIIGLDIITLGVMSIHIFFSIPTLFLARKQQYEYKYKLIVSVTLMMSVITILVSLFLISILPDKSFSLILGSACVQTFFGIILYIHNLIEGRAFFDRRIWREAIIFCIPLIPHNLAYFVLNSADRLMIDRMCSTSDAGIYSLASQISVAIGIVTNALCASLNPWLLSKLKSREFAAISKIINMIVASMSVILVTGSLVVPEVLLLAASFDYQAARWIMPPIMLGAYFLFLAGISILVSLYHERRKTIALASIVAAVTNIILNVIAIPIFGYMAAAYTTMISYGCFAAFHFVMAYRLSKEFNYEEILFDYKKIVLFSSITVFCSLGIMLLYDTPILRYMLVIGVTVIGFLNRKQIFGILAMMRRNK